MGQVLVRVGGLDNGDIDRHHDAVHGDDAYVRRAPLRQARGPVLRRRDPLHVLVHRRVPRPPGLLPLEAVLHHRLQERG